MSKLKKVDLSYADKIITIIRKKYLGRNIFLFSMGLLCSAFGLNLFFDPYNVVSTGSSGLALLLSRILNIDLSLMVFIVSFVLLIIGFIVFGFTYALKMVASTVLFPIFVTATTLITRYINLGDTSLFLIMILGGALLGFGSGLIRKSGYNPGGFAVLSDIMYKYFYMGIGTSGTIINSILIISSGFLFGFDSVCYSLIGLLVSSYIVDRVLIGISDNKVFYIITDNPFDVRDYIINKLHYSVTIVNAKGGYTHKRKKMLMCVVPTIEYVKLKELVGRIDSKAFFLIVDAYESSVKKNCKNM